MKRITKIIAGSLVAASISSLKPIEANATTGWFMTNSGWSYYDASGVKITSRWVYDNNKWYFLRADGIMTTGWLQYNGKWYYLNSNGAMAVNTISPDGYYLGFDGAWIPNIYQNNTISDDSNESTNSYTNNSAKSSKICYWGKELENMNFYKAYSSSKFLYANKYSNKTVNDNLNNEYSNFLTLYLSSSYTSNHRSNLCYIEFPLNGQYKQFKSKLGLTKKYQNNLRDGEVKIYLDDEEVYSTELKSGDSLKDIDIDLTGKNKIKFYFHDQYEYISGGPGYAYVEIGFFDGEFIK